jgi:hypothetical protein
MFMCYVSKQGEAQPKAFLVLPVSGSVPLDLFTLMLRRALELMGCTVKVCVYPYRHAYTYSTGYSDTSRGTCYKPA